MRSVFVAKGRHGLRAAMVGGTVLAVAGYWAGAQSTQPAAEGPVQINPKPAIMAQAKQLEDELGELMQRRATAPESSAAVLDVQIDLRVLADALLTRAAATPREMDADACAYLRAMELYAAAGDVQKTFARAVFTSEQLDALSRLHQMTFAIPATGSPAQSDELTRDVGLLLLKIFGPLPGGMTSLPMMRPRVSRNSAQVPGSERPRGLAELTAAAQRAAVSPELKQALLALAAATADPARQNDPAEFLKALSDSVELTESLQRGGMVEPQARDQTESRLTGAIYLFLDGRTRSAGAVHIEDLVGYQRMLARVQRMELPQDLHDKFVPAFTWALQHPADGGPVVMDAIETYVRLCAAHGARERPVVPVAQKRAIDTLEKRFTQKCGEFVSDAAGLEQSNDGPADAADGLQDDLNELSGITESISLIEQVPAEIKSLAAYKVRPGGALERRAMAAALILGQGAQGPAPDAARLYLLNVRKMSHMAGQIGSAPSSSEIDQQYANGHLADFNRHRAEVLTALAADAGNRELTRPQLAQLDAALQLGDALDQAARIESARQQPALSRWVDWQVSPDAISAVLQGYRDATAVAVQGFGQRDTQPFKAWEAVHRRAAAFLDLLDEVAKAADACADLPGDWPGDVAKLLTPKSDQPFGSERFASLVLAHLDGPNAPSPDAVLRAIQAHAAGSSR